MTTRSSTASRSLVWLVRACALVAVPTAVVTYASNASAQGWMADRRLTEGPGIRTGDLELHPGIGGEVGYDSNWFLRSSTEGPTIANGAPALPVREAGVLRVTPSFSVSTLGIQRIDNGGTARIEPRAVTFRAGAHATLRAFIGKEMSRQHNVGIGSDARLDLNAGRPIGFGVFAGYNRLIQPQVLSDPNLSFNRSDLRVGGDITAIPGGGTLDIRGSYQFLASLFEESQGVPYTSLTHEVGVRNRWRFRPRTALFSDTTLRFINYPNAARASNFLNDSTPLRTRFGITGLITDRFGALLSAGYGATFFQNPNAVTSPQYDSVNAQAEGTFYLSQTPGSDEPGKATLLLSSISLGVVRDFQTSLLSNFYNSNKAYAKVEYWFGGKMVITVNGYLEQLNYPTAFINNGPGQPPIPGNVTNGVVGGDFTNYRYGGGLFAEYRFSQSFGINTTVDGVVQNSDTQIISAQLANGTQTFFDLNYWRVQAFLGARYFF
jgi:hypothetical protein